MAAVTVDPLARGTLFPTELVSDLASKVNGHSALAKLSNSTPIGFNGSTEMVFDMPNEMEIVGEGGAKSHGGITVTPTTIIPIKFVYGARVSDEFIYGAEDSRLNYMKRFTEGFAKKAARALDLAAMHGVNPKTGVASTIVGTNNFDSLVTQAINGTAGYEAQNLETAITGLQEGNHEATGIAMAPSFAAGMGNTYANDVPLYPEFKFGNSPETFYGKAVDVNNTVNAGNVDDAIVGDFENFFRWGYAKEIPIEVIKYGDPDNTGADLAGHNQVYIRAEIYLGWGILDPTAFCRIKVPA